MFLNLKNITCKNYFYGKWLIKKNALINQVKCMIPVNN